MAELTLDNRVTNSEDLMATLVQEVVQLTREMREFKDESRLSRERSEAELRAYREKSGADW